MSWILLAAATPEHARDVPVDPLVVGGGAFVLLLLLMGALLMFGKGRPHT
jgi:hypothetical protein